jgi:hypothetical protein
MVNEARTARSRFYPVTIAYTAYALVVLPLGLRADARISRRGLSLNSARTNASTSGG